MTYPTSGGPTIPHRATVRGRIARALEREEQQQNVMVKAAIEAGARTVGEIATATGFAPTLARTVVNRLARSGEIPAGYATAERFGPPPERR
jgi:hypothetical protein